ncbi:Predicted heme/steroid binding protein [Malonomonas rubra DSM 5091]|uniref:Predicted heme/steroid binding protein n=1 Tax=Malonomonas rubra DSM 5091 TaxID=1122189 RepID=A0A1M6J8Q4_MALRU|nr:cytochrome b5 domain-containing protein [Malonomonas rubra]SHJ43044.1 Predicted heme/steroid binding protein [Malonomonas rubra DSM 5091]
MTKEELATFNGQNGQPTYVAVSGTIYDVSESKMWVDGNHVNAHSAGQDLTDELKSAPHVRTVVERFPVVGKLENEPEKKKKRFGLF